MKIAFTALGMVIALTSLALWQLTGAYATSWPWLSCVAVTSLPYQLDNRGIIQVSASGALAAVLATLLVAAVAFNAYYRSRGDME